MRRLEAPPGSMLVLSDEEAVARTGAQGSKITLPHIKKVSGSSFPYFMIQNGAGDVLNIPAPEGCIPHVIIGKDGQWAIAEEEPSQCYRDVCTDTPEYALGIVEKKDCEDVSRFCLVKFAVPEITTAELATIQSTACINVSGAGTEGNPYRISPRISADDGNCLECREDGLFAPCSTYGGSDPVDEI
jgi:hypothetical protein